MVRIMKPWKHACWPLVAGLVFAVGFAGCEEPGGGAGKGGATLESSGPPPPPPLAKAAAEGTQPDVEGSRAPAVGPSRGSRPGPPVSPPVARPVTSPPAVPPPPRTTAGSTASEVPAIRLSAGVALPQTGPTGILMSFSVDYKFTAGEPNPTSPYVWVIQRAKGGPARVGVRLGQKGTLPVLIGGWRPEQGPFQSHIEDASGNRLSRSISLR